MCLCVGYSQLHTCIKHAFIGEPYNCGEGTEGDLTSMSCLIDIYSLFCLPHRLMQVSVWKIGYFEINFGGKFWIVYLNYQPHYQPFPLSSVSLNKRLLV